MQKLLSILAIILVVSCQNSNDPTNRIQYDISEIQNFEPVYLGNDSSTHFFFDYIGVVSPESMDDFIGFWLVLLIENNNRILYDSTQGLGFDVPQGYSIAGNASWKLSAKLAEVYQNDQDNWPLNWDTPFTGNPKKYIGIKSVENEQNYFGWMELTVNKSTASFRIEDYFISNQPNQTVVAGTK